MLSYLSLILTMSVASTGAWPSLISNLAITNNPKLVATCRGDCLH